MGYLMGYSSPNIHTIWNSARGRAVSARNVVSNQEPTFCSDCSEVKAFLYHTGLLLFEQIFVSGVILQMTRANHSPRHFPPSSTPLNCRDLRKANRFDPKIQPTLFPPRCLYT
ncbi:hypothetical protein QBC46DRAFT_55667 [Diplogelasinospora grovesii]|uniref:Uncharacterized protein n=1 Tax=Diplogelasinospora grovesii TaxID=303347 RepID=A0AAN6N0D4_9PEZI|nr:hypothetical protein QBC46DRAFT_55667 [Diplogelasinospora grovesii]